MDLTRHLANLYLFARVIDAGGFAAAARELETTRSLLSRHIKALEKSLNACLLVRDARNLSLTAVGEQVYRQAILMCDAADSAIATAHAAVDNRYTQLRVGVNDALLPLVADMLAGFSMQHANTQLTVDGRTDPEALLHQHNDVVLQLGGTLPDDANIASHQLGHARCVIVASPGLLTKLGRLESPAVINIQHRLVYSGHGLGSHWLLSGIQPQPARARLVSDHISALLAAARAGTGLVQLPLYACDEAIAAGQLQTVFEAFEPEPLPLYALARASDAHEVLQPQLVEFLRAALAQMPSRGIISVLADNQRGEAEHHAARRQQA